MSRKKIILELEPPGYGVGEEKTEFEGFECPKCGGKGTETDCGFTAEKDREITCPRCAGIGVLRATVRVLWEPLF